MKRIIKYYIVVIVVLIITATTFATTMASSIENLDGLKIFEEGFVWPVEGYREISSYFGRRNRPTSGASSFHKGIDIPAPEGTKVFAIDDMKIYFAGWGAGGGYTICGKLINEDLKVSYCHMNPLFYCEVNDVVKKGQLIGRVGPKNVYGIKNNPYKDSNGNPTNGAMTGTHLHFSIKSDNVAIDPLIYSYQ